MQNAVYWVSHLELQEHPEGGFYKETYRSKGSVKQNCLPNEFSGKRSFSTSIYFLLRSSDRSRFHRIKSDELWHYHAGSSLTLFLLNEEGLTRLILGSNMAKNESLQVVIPANTWFGALVNEPESYVLSGCTVSPGFDFADFEIADRNQLLTKFPDHQAIIQTLT
jgi:predicted cupin superfamily sugar epimerase